MRVMFILNGPTANRGCEAILLSTHAILSDAYPNARFLNCSVRDDRAVGTNYLQIPSLKHRCHPNLRSIQGIRWAIARGLQNHQFNFERFLSWADVVLSLGGDNYSLDYGTAHIYFNAIERVLKAKKRLVIWGASIGPFSNDKAFELKVAKQLSQVHRIVVRENRTREYLEGIGVSNNVLVQPDPAFSLAVGDAELPVGIHEMLSVGALGLNLSPLLARYRSEPQKWVDEAARWVSHLLDDFDLPVLLIPHVMTTTGDDQAFLMQVKGKVDAPANRLQVLNAYELSSGQIKGVISRLRLFAGSRTHATIAGLSTNVPTISIGYSVKAYGINEEVFGHTDWVVDHLKLDGAKLTQKIRDLMSAEEQVRAQLKRANATYRVRTDTISEAIK